MLNVTVLKVKHETEADARKLLRHIQGCDIYSPEHQGGTLKEAIFGEKRWREEFLKMSRSALLKTLEGMSRADWRPENAYKTKEADYLFRQQKPVVILERFSEEESRYVLQLVEKSDRGHDEAMALLLSGNSPGRPIALVIEAACTSALEVRLRDQHIAANLAGIEGYIRGENPSLREKSAINLTLCLGTLHSPEKYSALLIKPELIDKVPYDFQLSENASDYLPRDILAYSIACLFRSAHMRLDPEMFKSAPMGELERILGAHRATLRAILLARGRSMPIRSWV